MKLALAVLSLISLTGCTALGGGYTTKACAAVKWAEQVCQSLPGEEIPDAPPVVEAAVDRSRAQRAERVRVRAAQSLQEAK